MHLWSQLSEIHPLGSVYQPGLRLIYPMCQPLIMLLQATGGRLKEEGFKNLQAEIWHLNTQKYKNLFSLAKISKEA